MIAIDMASGRFTLAAENNELRLNFDEINLDWIKKERNLQSLAYSLVYIEPASKAVNWLNAGDYEQCALILTREFTSRKSKKPIMKQKGLRKKRDRERQTRVHGLLAYCLFHDGQASEAANIFNAIEPNITSGLSIAEQKYNKRNQKKIQKWWAYLYHVKSDVLIELGEYENARAALHRAKQLGSMATPAALAKIDNWMATRTAILERSRQAKSIEEKHASIVELGLLIEEQGLTQKITSELVRLVATLRVLPATDAEAKRLASFAQLAFDDAQSMADFDRAADYYMQAVTRAPAWSNLYFNLGLVHEARKDYAAAAQSYQLFLDLSPNDDDIAVVKRKLTEMEYRVETEAE